MKLHLDIHDARFGEQLSELEALPVRGVPFWDETVLYQRPTQTLLGADIVCWGAPVITGPGVAPRASPAARSGCASPPDARKKITDESAAASSIQAMLQRPARRLIVGHGDVIEDGWRDRLADAWRLEGVQV